MDPARLVLLPALVLGAACGGRPASPPGTPPQAAHPAPDSVATRLPAVPKVAGPLVLRVVYPSPEARIQLRDSSFLLGSAGTGEARVTVNGYPVKVWPNGAWLAWIPFPSDSIMQFTIEGRTAQDSARLLFALRRAGERAGPATDGLWLDSLSLSPRGRVWWPRGEYLTLTARASPGADVRLRLADGSVIPLSSQTQAPEVPDAVRAFERDTSKLRVPPRTDRYVGVVRGRSIGPPPGPMLPATPRLPAMMASTSLACSAGMPCVGGDAPWPDSLWATVEAIRGVDTVRARWPLQLAPLDTLPLLAELHDDSARVGDTDSLTVGRALPGGTYHWFFPSGTRTAVSGRLNDDVRVRLSSISEAWVAAGDVRPLYGAPAAPAVVGSVTLTAGRKGAVLRIPLNRRVPFQVTESSRSLAIRLYGTVGDVNWIRYGVSDSLVPQVSWAQTSADETVLSMELGASLWGYRARWERGDLLLEVRRPPVIDRSHPLRGLLLAVDPGHPPAGATGPTGLREAEANLAIALDLRRQLEAAGAKVLMTRTTDTPVDLWPRVKLAESADADLLISVHNNALPDGINPFSNSGSSVYYNQPRSIPLARAIQVAQVRRLGLRDLGIGRGDLALVRATWMPSVLTEGMFMILPEQEAALRTPEGQHLYALAVYEGVRDFLRERAQD
jgi:N-acetylmuramoyl-L-alanine amidase